MDLVPVVDISSPTSTSRRALDDACRDHGFFLLEGHGLDELIDRTWDQTTRLFDAERTVRTAIARDADNPLGWYDRELTKRRRDHKEVFDFIEPNDPLRDRFNRWPGDLPGFRDAMAEFYDGFSRLAQRTLDLLHDTLELSEDGRAAMVTDRTAGAVRLNHYPVGDPVPAAQRVGLADLGSTALGFHTDPGTLTLLLQDGTGGLQAESRVDGWIDVPPRAGTVVVNLADAMQVWTNDRYRAAVHRVVPMTARRRFSIPYFANPPRDAMIEPIPQLCEVPARYRRFRWSDFMRARTDDNLVDAGVDDAQISDYSIA